MFPFSNADGPAERERQERQLALEHLAEAWNAAEQEGCEPEALAHAALFAALATLVKAHGEDATAKLVADLADRVTSGHYSVGHSLQ
jgi:hypothetical protein